MSKSENNFCLFGICSLGYFIAAVVTVGVVIGGLSTYERILNHIFPPKEKTPNIVANTVVTDGGKMEQKANDCSYMALQTGSSGDIAAPVKASAKATSHRRAKNASNKNIPKTLKRQSSTSGESSRDSLGSTDVKSSSYWSSTDCSKSRSKENVRQPRENLIPEVSETDEDAVNTSTKIKTLTSSTTRRKRFRRRRNSSKVPMGAAKTIDIWLEGGHHHFNICQLGGEVELPFCTARFPKHAVKELKTLRFLPQVKHESDLKVVVHPIHCSTPNQNGAISFNCSVNFKIKIDQDLDQILRDIEEAELQITECSIYINWITAQRITIKKAEGYIFLTIKRFAGPPCRLEVSVTNKDFNSESVSFKIENPCQNFQKTNHIRLSKKNFMPISHDEMVHLNYNVSVSGDSKPKEVLGWFPLQWTTSDSKKSTGWLEAEEAPIRAVRRAPAVINDLNATVNISGSRSAPAVMNNSNTTINISGCRIEMLHVNAPNVD